jgi:NAD(P)-dependent dehydrogenase (short-subunit alcohol dehydrogenase family)
MRTALVTGGARGLGFAIASRLHAGNIRVAIVDVRDAGASALRLDPTGERVRGFACDLGDSREIPAMMAEVTEWGGPCDIVVHNAALFPTTPLSELSLATWRRIHAVNVDAALVIAQHAVAGMSAAGWGRIVLIASGTIGIVRRDVSAYIASKMALTGFVRALSARYGKDGITANVIAPGFTETDGTREKFEKFDLLAASVIRQQAVPQLTTKEQIAAAVSFLASDEAGRINGQTWMCDGGWVRA